jgi:heme-degrading monooxygenase HmoA
MVVFTSGEWHVRAGREAEFRRVWAEFGGLASAAQGEEAPVAVLLRDNDDPLHFRSFGRWPSEQASAEWQASAAFSQWMASLRETLDSMESYNLEVAETVGRAEQVFAGSAPARTR